MVSSTPRPHFTPGKDTVTIVQEAGWAPGPVWRGGKSRRHRDSIPGPCTTQYKISVKIRLTAAQPFHVGSRSVGFESSRTLLGTWRTRLKTEPCRTWHDGRSIPDLLPLLTLVRATAVAQWLSCCATNREVAGSIPAGVIGIFH